MGFAERLQDDTRRALKAGDRVTVSTLRLVSAAAKNKEVALRRPLSDDEWLEVLAGQVKMRREAIEQYRAGQRADLVAQEEAELTVLQTYLPPPLTAEALEQEIAQAISETGATSLKEMGTVMKLVLPRVRGRADNAVVSERVRARLGGAT